MKLPQLILTPLLAAALVAGTATTTSAQNVAPGRKARQKPAVEKAQQGPNAAKRLRNIAANSKGGQAKAVRKHSAKQAGAKLKRALSKAKTKAAKQRIRKAAKQAAKKATRNAKRRGVARPGAKIKPHAAPSRAAQGRRHARGKAPAAKGAQAKRSSGRRR